MTNHGSTPLNITNIWISFNVFQYSQTNDCGSQIPAGGSCQIAVTLAPGRTGKIQGQLSVSDDGGASPQTVLLTGSGT